jgi:glycosyltransferase involved in cell wall biosynthesis
MRVSFYVADQNPQRDRSLGITGYTNGLLGELVGQPELELHALCSRSSYHPPAGVAVTTLPFATERRAARLLADHGACALTHQPELWHFPKGHLPLLKPHRPCVGTIHDTIVLHYARRYPQTRSALEFEYWRRVLAGSLRRLERVCTVSKSARDQILAFCDEEGIAPPPIDVTYEGARWESQAGTPPDEPRGEYVLHLGSSLPHKRTVTLLEHWRVLQARGVSLPPLRIVGEPTAAAREIARPLAGVTIEARAEQPNLRRLLAGARALILPSEIEGFGLPALEAAYLATPAVYARGTAVEEVMQGTGLRGFVLQDPDDLRAALDAALGLGVAERCNIGLQLRERFAWARCAQHTLESYRAALD